MVTKIMPFSTHLLREEVIIISTAVVFNNQSLFLGLKYISVKIFEQTRTFSLVL